jgi:hypothetical protein
LTAEHLEELAAPAPRKQLDRIVDRSLVKGLGKRSEERASGSQAPADEAA